MKKALAFLSALALGSSSNSDNFLAYHKPSVQTLPYRKPYAPTTFYADDEQYAPFNIVQNWHYPLKPLPMTNSYVPSPAPVEIQAPVEKEDDSVENLLFDLLQNFQKQMEVTNNKQEVRQMKVQGQGSSARHQEDADDRTNVLPPHEPQPH